MKLFDLFYRRLRLKNPWNYKAPLLLAGPYFVIAASRVPWDRALFGMLASLCTIIGIAGFAYFLNDLTDARKDILAGKDNVVAGWGTGLRALVLVVFLVAALAPWLYLPLTRTSALLLMLEFALFLVYCVPPFRFKERGVLGLLTDASYAHALPAVLASLTFSYLADQPYPRLREFLVALGVWQGILGVRNIVLHQLQDHDADVISGYRTLAVVFGPARLANILTFVLVPMEIAAAVAFALIVSDQMPWLIPAYGAFVLLTLVRNTSFGRPSPSTVRERLYAFADDFYTDWLPILILGYLVAVNPKCWPIAVLHVVLFRNGLRQTWRDLRGHAGWHVYALIFLMLVPSLVWILIDRSLWLSDAALYGLDSLRLNHALGLGVAGWWDHMLYVMPKPPLLPWLGQFFVPVGRALGHVDSGLLLLTLLVEYLALVAIYRALLEYFQRRSVALAGCLAVASTPIVISGSEQFFAQALQFAAVSWFVYIMAKAHKWHAGYTLLHLMAAATCAMLAILSSPIFVIVPGVMALREMWKNPMGGPRWSRNHAVLLGVVVTLLFAAGSWYLRNWDETLSYAGFAYNYRVHGIPDGLMAKASVWANLAFNQYRGTALLVLAAVPVFLGGAAGIWRLRAVPTGLPRWQILAIFAQIALVFLVFISSAQQNDRYLLALAPYAALLVAWLVFQMPFQLGRVAMIGLLVLQLAASHFEKFDPREQHLNRLLPVGLSIGPERERAMIEAIITATSGEPDGSVVLATGLLGIFNSEVEYEAAKRQVYMDRYFSGRARHYDSLEFLLLGSSTVGETHGGPEQVWNDIQAEAGFIVLVSRDKRNAVRNHWRGTVGEIARTWFELLESASEFGDRVEGSNRFAAIELAEYPEITVYARTRDDAVR